MIEGIRSDARTGEGEPAPVGHLAVRVHPPGAQVDVHALAEWIGEHASVRAVRHDRARGDLVIHYDERTGSGRLLRGALLDRIRETPPPARTYHVAVRVAHALPGRLRLHLADAPPRAIERLAAFVATLDGVSRARPSPASGSVVVLFDPRRTSPRALFDAIARDTPASWPELSSPTESRREWVKAGLTAAVLGSAISGIVPAPLILSAVAATGIPPLRRACASLMEGRVNVDVMDATAISICLLRAEPIAASVITTLLAIGDLILDRTQARARGEISRLMKLGSDDAYLLEAPGLPPRRVRARDLKIGDRIVVYPGARIPADGAILEGSLAVDEKALTGESVPRERVAGDQVLAASVATCGQAVVEIERAGGDTVAARIVQILEGAGAKPMTLQRNAERSADRLVVPTFAVAGAAWAASGMVDRLTSVLITDFGTGVRVAVPTAALAAMTLGAREGVLFKGASFLERLAEVDTVVFDKTGTLTMGVPEVTSLVATSSAWSDRELAAFAAAAESNQTHPIADAVRRHATKEGAPAWEVDFGSDEYRIGLGLTARVRERRVCLGSVRMMRAAGIDVTGAVEEQRRLAAEGSSSVLLAVDGELVAIIGYADAPRPESRDVIARLRKGGRRRVLLLSGDARAPVQAIARELGIDEAISEVLPEEKAEVVRRLKAEGRKVAMIGDGINDAPALALADVGISLQGATEVALETADVVLLEGGLARLPVAFQLSDDAVSRVKEVLGAVLVPNAIAILAGAVGLLNPVTAAIVNNGSTIAASVHAISPLLRRGAKNSR